MSDKVIATKQATRSTPDGTFTATAELHTIGNQEPYFGITGELRKNGRVDRCGCMHDEVEKYAPELAPYLRWHLTSTKGPMHYQANARYHAGFCDGMESSRNLDHLCSTIVYGAVETDQTVDLEVLTEEQLDQFLVARFPALMLQFQTDMETLFGSGVLNDHLIKMGIELPAPRIPKAERDKARLAKQRQDLIDRCDKTTREAIAQRDGMVWLLDHGVSIDNVIYYSHRDVFTFGWREPVSRDAASRLLDLASEFPFEYEIKAVDKVYSGRE